MDRMAAGNTRLGRGARGSSPLVSAYLHGSRRAHAIVLRTPAPHGLLASVRQNKLHVSSNRYAFDLRPVRSSYGSLTLNIFRKTAWLDSHAPRGLAKQSKRADLARLDRLDRLLPQEGDAHMHALCGLCFFPPQWTAAPWALRWTLSTPLSAVRPLGGQHDWL